MGNVLGVSIQQKQYPCFCCQLANWEAGSLALNTCMTSVTAIPLPFILRFSTIVSFIHSSKSFLQVFNFMPLDFQVRYVHF